MAKNSLVIYYSYRDKLADLTYDQLGKLFIAMIDYDMKSIIPDFKNDVALKMAWSFIKADLDVNKDKYENICKRNMQNIQSRWNTKNTSGISRIPDYTKNTDNDNDNDNVNDNVNDNDNIEEKDKKEDGIPNGTPVHSQKHKYGEYKKILLTDDELAKLNADYGEERTQQAITYLDEYIEMKGTKYKSHYLALRKWVFEALKEKDRKQTKTAQQEEKGMSMWDKLDKVFEK